GFKIQNSKLSRVPSGARLFLFAGVRTRWRGAARLKVAGATACVDFGEITKTQFKIGYFNKIKSESRQRRVIIGGSAFGRAPHPPMMRLNS
ncbi:MAG: hypothetical protein IIW74_05830, partial [Rikenellaceae bacterium]|nr:hypothetical protein [Rikenellaceae bacterium]